MPNGILGNSIVNPSAFEVSAKLTKIADLAISNHRVEQDIRYMLTVLVESVQTVLQSKNLKESDYHRWNKMLEHEIIKVKSQGFDKASAQSLTHALSKIKREADR